MNTKIDKFSEMEKGLSVKDATNVELMSLFGRFGLVNLLRHLSLEKLDGINAATLILALCLFRLNGKSIFSAYKSRFHGLLDTGKNCFYRMMLRSSMDWRRLLLGFICRFQSILRKERADRRDTPRCYLLDDTTLEKSGFSMECVSRVYDHVCGRCVLGFKLLLLAVSDGISTLPVDFSLHREKGKNGSYGLSGKQQKKQYKCIRKALSPANTRLKECDRSKLDVAIEMLERAWRSGIRANYLLADSWFTCESLIAATRRLGKGAVHYIGLAKMGKTKYKVGGKSYNAHSLVALHQREVKQCRKYKCLYVALRGRIGVQPVRIFLIKYGRNENWNILLSSDTDMKFVQAFELYQMRWSIEVLNKECKGYLRLGTYQGRNFDGQIADCTLCFITYTVLALGKRFSDYETMGDLFRAEQEQLLTLTLWNRVLACIKRLLECLSETLGITPEQMLQGLLDNENAMSELSAILNELQEKSTDNERLAG